MPMDDHGAGDADAVSPVIGAIMMVAITVILAAVVTGAFLGFKPIPQESQTAAVNVNYDPNGDQVWVTYVDKGNSDYINVTFQSRATAGEAKVALATVGSTAVVNEGERNVTIRGDGNWAYNFSAGTEPTEDNVINVVVTAVQGESSTVIYTDQGGI